MLVVGAGVDVLGIAVAAVVVVLLLSHQLVGNCTAARFLLDG